MDLIKRARELRKNQTPAEKKLWKHLKDRQLSEYKFRRQHPVENIYIADFCCLAEKLIIEIDGSIHKEEEVKNKDEDRTYNLEQLGYSIIRFTNDEVLYSIEEVLFAIHNKLKEQ